MRLGKRAPLLDSAKGKTIVLYQARTMPRFIIAMLFIVLLPSCLSYYSDYKYRITVTDIPDEDNNGFFRFLTCRSTEDEKRTVYLTDSYQGAIVSHGKVTARLRDSESDSVFSGEFHLIGGLYREATERMELRAWDCKLTNGVGTVSWEDGELIPDPRPPKRKLQPYNPQKAGANIVESYDLSEFLQLPRKPSAYDGRIYDLAADEANFYLRLEVKDADFIIYVLDRNTMAKTREIRLNNDNGALSPVNQGFIILDGKMLIPAWRPRQGLNVYTTEGDYIRRFIPEEEFGLSPKRVYFWGFDRATNTLWLKYSNEWSYDMLYGFAYNADTDSFGSPREFVFKPDAERIPPMEINYISVYENIVWNARDIHIGATRNLRRVYIEKRDLLNPFTVLHTINVDDLGTLSIPASILYEPPYLWVLVEKDARMRLLKLLPL
jgi:hypothetical protein